MKYYLLVCPLNGCAKITQTCFFFDSYISFVVKIRQTHLARILGGHVIYKGIDLTWEDAHDSERCHIERYTRARLEISPAHLVERIQ